MSYRNIILSSLLEKWECSSQRGQERPRRAIRLNVTPSECPFYFDETNPEPRAQFIIDAKMLEQDGFVLLRRDAGPLSHEIKAVDLMVSRVTDAYRLIGKKDPEQGRAQLLACLQHEIDASDGTPAWYRAMLDTLRAELSGSDIPRGPMSPYEFEEGQDVLKAVGAVVRLGRPERLRALSIRLFGDSKRLEALAARIASLCRRYDPALHPAGDDPLDVLKEYGVERKAALLSVRGRIIFRDGGDGLLSTEGWKPFMGVPEDVAVNWRIERTDARAVVTVENEEPFSALCRLPALPDGLVVVYTGGFSNRSRVAFLRKVDAATGGSLPFFHWGDLDVGGFRILLHMRKAVRRDIRMLFATPDAVERFSGECGPLSKEQLQVLRKEMVADTLAEDIAPAIDKIVINGVRIEQEIMDPTEVLGQIIDIVGSLPT